MKSNACLESEIFESKNLESKNKIFLDGAIDLNDFLTLVDKLLKNTQITEFSWKDPSVKYSQEIYDDEGEGWGQDLLAYFAPTDEIQALECSLLEALTAILKNKGSLRILKLENLHCSGHASKEALKELSKNLPNLKELDLKGSDFSDGDLLYIKGQNDNLFITGDAPELPN